MRLTLRTLLAYLDQILEESDARELEHKVQESELARQLVHRIRSVLGHRRLNTLDVHAEGLGRDAQSVAEYLDNTLKAEQISDFERVCLESDVHLSEVAACHQILTLVLGEPAAVPDGLKERIYRLPHEPRPVRSIASSAVSAIGPGIQSERTSSAEVLRTPVTLPTDDAEIHRLLDLPAALGSTTAEPQPSVGPSSESGERANWEDEDEHWTAAPDYLRRPRRARWLPIATSALIAFCLALAGLRGMGPLDQRHPLAQRLGWFPATPVAPSGASDNANRSTESRDGANSIDASTPVSTPEELTSPAKSPPLDLPSASPVVGEPIEPPRESDSLTATAEPAATDDQTEATLPALEPTTTEEDRTTQAEPTTGPQGEFETDTADTTENLADSLELPLPGPDLTEPTRQPPDNEETAAAPPQTELDAFEPAGATAAAAPDRTEVDGVPRPRLVNPLADTTRELIPSVNVPPPLPSPIPDTSTPVDPIGTPGLPDTTSSAVPSESRSPAASAVTGRPADIGRFLDAQQVLIQLDLESNHWQRVEVGAPLQVGDLLMALPTYRSPLVLASGLQVTLIGGTRIEVLEPDSRATPFLRLEFGRLTVATFGQTGTTFGLRWGSDQSGVLTLADMNTTVAVELCAGYPLGTDPEAGPPHQMLSIYVTSGSAEWNAAPAPPITVTAGQRLTLVDQSPALLADVTEEPAWIDGRDARPRDPLAARDLGERLGTDRPVSLVLREEADSRRFELRSLAVCSLAYLGEFEPLLVALNDTRLRSYWPAQYEVLALVPGYSAELASNLKQAAVQRHGEDDGLKLCRLLWGYSPEQLAEDGAIDLVDWLDHPSYDFRIVASEQLKSITGQPSLYRANAGDRDPQRRAAVTRWRKLLDSGEIKYAELPELDRLLSAATSPESEQVAP